MVIRIFLRYDGAPFCGWQVQNKDGVERSDTKTVQGIVLSALKKLLLVDNLTLTGCSRTDSGVHACEYCASFEIDNPIVPPERIAYAISHLLPEKIVVYKSEIAPDGFNARFDVKSKTYKYFFYTSEFADPLSIDHSWHIKTPHTLDADAMNEAAKAFIGTHYFDSFCNDVANAKSTCRTIFDACVSEIYPNFFVFSVTGDGFLYNMVRIMTGTLVNVGAGRTLPSEIPAIIEARDRTKSGFTAPPQGLHLYKVIY